jgi:uncharacterized protein
MYANSATTTATTATGTTGGSPIRNFMKRHPIISFFTLLLAGVWLAYLPVLLGQDGFGLFSYSVPFPVELINLPASLFGSALAGFIVAWATGGKEGMRELRRRIFRWRVNPGWYLAIIAGVPTLAFLSASDWLGVKTFDFVTHQLPAFGVTYLIQAVIIAGLVSLWEEAGLTGYATNELQEHRSPLMAVLVVAPLWALMHVPAFFIPALGTGSGTTAADFFLSLGILTAAALAVRVIVTFIFNSTGRSVLLVAVFHGAMNSTQSTLTNTLPGYSSLYLLVGMGVVAVLLIVFTKGRLGYKRQLETPAQTPALQTTTTAGVA